MGAGNTISYEYDPLGRRRAKIVNGVTTKYASDGAEEIEERDGSNNVLRRYAYGPSIDDRIAMFDTSYCPHSISSQSWCFYLTNWQGSTTTMVKRDGSLREVYHYGPYGEGVNWVPQDALTGNPFRYTGRRVDPETRLYYYRARYYSTKLGRFLQVDPIGTKDDLNLYAYVYNDPANGSDPTGTERIKEDFDIAVAERGEPTVGSSPEAQQAAQTLKVAVGGSLVAVVALPGVALAVPAGGALLNAPAAVVTGQTALAAAPATAAMAAPVTAAVTATSQAVTQVTSRAAVAAAMEVGAELHGVAAAARGVAGAGRVAEMAEAGAIQQEVRAGIQAAVKGAEKMLEVVKQCVQGKC